MPCQEEFLKHENIEIRRISNDGLCSEYMEVSLLLKNNSTGSLYLRSLLNIPTRSVAVFPANRNLDPKEDIQSHRMVVKSKFILPQKQFLHDFTQHPVFELKVDLEVDCSNLLHTPIDSLYAAVLDANEKRLKNGRSAVDIGFENNGFVWTGKTRWRIEKETTGEPLSKNTDLREYQKSLEIIQGIKHYAIMDSKTCEFWVKSADFEFKTYFDEKVKTDENINGEVNEKNLLMNYFKAHGNVKSFLGFRILGEKFGRNKDGYDYDRHFVSLFNEGKTLFGCAGRTENCIVLAIYEKPADGPVQLVEQEIQISNIFDRLLDTDRHYREKVFHESHRLTLTALFMEPGCYDINHLSFFNLRNEVIPSMNSLEEVKITIKDRSQVAPEEVDLLA